MYNLASLQVIIDHFLQTFTKSETLGDESLFGHLVCYSVITEGSFFNSNSIEFNSNQTNVSLRFGMSLTTTCSTTY